MRSFAVLRLGRLLRYTCVVWWCVFFPPQSSWVNWMATVVETHAPSKLNYGEMIVPTKDSVRYKFLMSTLVTQRKSVLLTGETGTGKTVNISNMLQFDLGEAYLPLTLTFSARTSANQTQDIIGAYL